MVLHRPQTLVPSSSGTTSDGRIGARGRMAWCFTARKPLFLRRQAPRRIDKSGHWTGRRGASPPANPYFFVVRHHVGWANRGTGPDGVVLHRPQTLISSSRGTTSDGRIGALDRTAWCFTARKPLFLRRQAPRRMGESEHWTGRRGASPPANPCSFVDEHHAPDFLQADNSWNPRRVPGILISPKNEKCRPWCCSRSTSPTFSLFPLNR